MYYYTKKHLGLFVIAMILAGCDKNELDCCKCPESEGRSDVYEYPLKPGMPEWADLETNEEMFKAVQIPEKRLRRMCTIGVVDSWLIFPLRTHIILWHPFQIQKGFDRLTNSFNGLQELLRRPEAGEMLFRKYKLYDPGGYGQNASPAGKGMYMIDLSILEFTLAQTAILDRFSSLQKKELVREALVKRRQKTADPVYGGPLTHLSDAYIMARVMKQDKYEPFLDELDNDELIFFTETATYIYRESAQTPDEDLLKILHHAENYVKR